MTACNRVIASNGRLNQERIWFSDKMTVENKRRGTGWKLRFIRTLMLPYCKYLAALPWSRILGGKTEEFILTGVNKIIWTKPQHVLFKMPIFKQSPKSPFLPQCISLSYPAEKIFFLARLSGCQGFTPSWFCALKGIAQRLTAMFFLFFLWPGAWASPWTWSLKPLQISRILIIVLNKKMQYRNDLLDQENLQSSRIPWIKKLWPPRSKTFTV